jgi:UDP-2,3-diacylglucosamine hydrolase
MKKTFFISDAHLGSWAIADSRQQERRVVRFLDSIKDEAAALYMLGDMFDFWHEYRYAVPKGFTRFLGKLSELSDAGVEVHFITGNHDLWMKDYLHEECGVRIHQEKIVRADIGGKHFYLSHGDALDRKDRGYMVLRGIFRNKVCQALFASLHPRWGLKWGYLWARHSRLKHEGQEGIYLAEDQDNTLAYVREFVKSHPDTDYFMIGHRHIDQQTELPNGGKFIILGDWITKFTVAAFDGNELTTYHFE